MSPAFAGLITPLYRNVVALLERVAAGQPLTLDESLRLVNGWLEETYRRSGTDAKLREEYERARYGLVSWIDEVLTNSAWGRSVGYGTQEHSLEYLLYNTRVRSRRFYDMARRSLDSGTTDPLEAYLLCVTLGFVGDYRTKPAEFSDWVADTYERVAEGNDLPDRPFPEQPRAARGELSPLGGPRLLLTASLLVAATAVVTLACYIASVHLSVS